VPAPTLSSFRIGAQSKQKPRRPKSSFYGDRRRGIDGTWKGGVDSSQIPDSQRPHDEDMFPSNVYDDEYDFDDYCYSCVCMADHRSPQDLPFYKDHWLIDSGASDHITPYLGDFSSILQGERLASTANGSIIQMHGPGTVILKQDRPKVPPVLLTGVWYAPEAAHRLLSVTALTSHGFTCKITNVTKIWDRQGKLVVQASVLLPTTPLHWFRSTLITPGGSVYSLQAGDSTHLWHLRLGHPSRNALHHAHKHLKGIPILQDHASAEAGPCKGCQLGKAHQRAFPPSSKRSDRVLGLIHTDLCEFPILSRSHAKWMITFIDDASGFSALHFLRSKADAVIALQNLIIWAEAQTGYRLRSIRSDRGGEYINQSLRTFLSSRGIEHQTSVPRTPQQNGRAERFNRTILEKSEAMRQHACLPPSFWQDAVETSLHIYNRQPMRRLDWSTPIFKWNGEKPDVSYFKVFGSQAYVFVPKEERQHKLSAKAEEAIFIGYEKEPKATNFGLQSVDVSSSLQPPLSTSLPFLSVPKREKTNHPRYLFHIPAITSRSPPTCQIIRTRLCRTESRKTFRLRITINLHHRKINTPINSYHQRTVKMSNSNLDQRLLNPISNLHHLIVHLLNHLVMSKNLDAV
jgi:transposase InsO family protein